MSQVHRQYGFADEVICVERVLTQGPSIGAARGSRMSAKYLLPVLGFAVVSASGCCALPKYEPAYWNDGGTVQFNNNCYNYGNNKRTDTFAQPGRAAGAMYQTIDCQAVRDAALKDGLTQSSPDGTCPCDSRNCRDKLALVVWPNDAGGSGVDYHWYRRDEDGMWTHKPGATEATNLDQSSHPITDPQTADRGPYTVFCGYLCTCSSSKQGQGYAKIK
jgi:hypothetical protein